MALMDPKAGPDSETRSTSRAEHLISIRGTCDRLQVSRTTVFLLLQSKELQRVRIRNRTLVTASSIEALIARSIDAAGA